MVLRVIVITAYAYYKKKHVAISVQVPQLATVKHAILTVIPFNLACLLTAFSEMVAYCSPL